MTFARGEPLLASDGSALALSHTRCAFTVTMPVQWRSVKRIRQALDEQYSV